MIRPNIPPLYIPQFPPTKKQIRDNLRRQKQYDIQTCLICKNLFDNLDKKHDDERLSSCYCSFKCWGASLDGIYAEIEYRRKNRLGHPVYRKRNHKTK